MKKIFLVGLCGLFALSGFSFHYAEKMSVFPATALCELIEDKGDTALMDAEVSRYLQKVLQEIEGKTEDEAIAIREELTVELEKTLGIRRHYWPLETTYAISSFWKAHGLNFFSHRRYAVSLPLEEHITKEQALAIAEACIEEHMSEVTEEELDTYSLVTEFYYDRFVGRYEWVLYFVEDMDEYSARSFNPKIEIRIDAKTEEAFEYCLYAWLIHG